ncbi:MAG: hypothetical protein ACRDRX_25965 [Pseudonocardiaceae bacterium]
MEIVVLALGALLLLTGLVGGGFELREVKIPRVGRVARVLSTIAGAVLVLAGIGMVAQPAVADSLRGSSSSSGSTEIQPAAATFTIFDQLGDGQLSEQVTVLLDGRRVGHLTISADFPYSEMTVTVPRPGQYSFTVEATAWFVNGETGETFSYIGAGQGMVQVEDGNVFGLAGSVSGNTWVITLVKS